jgi:hypothetical protein
MQNESEPVAKRRESGEIEWTCPLCGGWDRLCEVYYSFLPFIDHLIRDLCVMEHPTLQNPRIVGDEVWYQVPGTTRMLPGLPSYDPNSPEWKELLSENRKIHSQAKLFLPDIRDWLEQALISLDGLDSIQKSSVLTAEVLISLVGKLEETFKEQRGYLLNYKSTLEQTGTDPKWLARPGNQARFVADSMAGARWGLAASSSREMIREGAASERQIAFKLLKIPRRRLWWLPE